MSDVNFIAVLDKAHPPQHSFVDGMLADTLPNAGLKVLLLTSRPESLHTKKVGKYIKAIYVGTLLERRGIKRFLNFFKLFNLLNTIKKKPRYKTNTILFIRNEPIYLMVSFFFRKKFDKIIFQQSFPHEKTRNVMKKYITINIFRFFGKHVSTVVGISELGVKRIKNYFPTVQRFISIPMCVTNSELRQPIERKPTDPIRFVYIGTHGISRDIDVILKAIILVTSKVDATFTFIGGTDKEIKNLKRIVEQRVIEEKIIFIPKMERKKVLNLLKNYDVGIGLIPDKDMYAESTATKIVEYASKGLAILSNPEIDFNNKFLSESSGGYLCNFNIDSVANKIFEICMDKELYVKKIKAFNYVRTNFMYDLYVGDFLK